MRLLFVDRDTVSPLILRAVHGRIGAVHQGLDIVDGKLEVLYGTVRMVRERGEWKVDETSWHNELPGNLAPTRAAGSPPADKAAPKTAAKAQGASVVGATSAAPRKLGAVKPPCVYKPVMTAEDVENCR